MRHSWLMSLWLGCFFLSLPAFGQTFEDGYQSYVKNQFPVAEFQFKSALKNAPADEEKAFILKFIGICQYMRGDKKSSQATFTQALQLDHNVQIDSEEVLDPGVVTFFNGIKAKVPQTKTDKKSVPAQQEEILPTPPNSDGTGNQLPPPKSSAPGQPLPSFGTLGKQKKGKTAKKAAPSSSGVSFTQFLPFGFPQYHNKSWSLGIGMTVLQLYSVYSFVDADKVIKDRTALNGVVASKPGLTDEQRNAFYADNNKFIKKVKNQKNMALASFGLLWGASIAESFLFHKTPAKTRSVGAEPIKPQQSITPVVEASRAGGSYGLSWQTELK